MGQCYVSQTHHLLSDHFVSCQTSLALYEPVQIITEFMQLHDSGFGIHAIRIKLLCIA